MMTMASGAPCACETDAGRDGEHYRSSRKGQPNPYAGVPIQDIDLATFEPLKYYRLPADPWHIVCRWKKEGENRTGSPHFATPHISY